MLWRCLSSFLKQEADGRSILQLIYVNAKALGQGGRRGALLPKPKSSLNYVQFLEVCSHSLPLTIVFQHTLCIVVG